MRKERGTRRGVGSAKDAGKEGRTQNTGDRLVGGVVREVASLGPGEAHMLLGVQGDLRGGGQRRKEVHLHGEAAISELPGKEGRSDADGQTGLLLYLAVKGGFQGLALFHMPSGDLPGTGEEPLLERAADQEQPLPLEDGGGHADLCTEVGGHGSRAAGARALIRGPGHRSRLPRLPGREEPRRSSLSHLGS